MAACAKCGDAIPAEHCRPIVGDKQYHAACYTPRDVPEAKAMLRLAHTGVQLGIDWLDASENDPDVGCTVRNAIRYLYTVLDVLGEKPPILPTR